MVERNLQSALNTIRDCQSPTKADLECLLAEGDCELTRQLIRLADKTRACYLGEDIYLRGVIEFSNVCGNTCAYCGLNKYNAGLPRYRMTREQILESVNDIAEAGIKTVVLQSGEDEGLNPFWLARVIEDIKSEFDIAVTLSVGEWSREEYRLWRQAGADRYLLKIETTNPALYRLLHPGMCFENRIRCLSDLKTLGFQTGSGDIVGLKNQSHADLASDILFFQEEDFDMLGIGPFIPHPDTPLAGLPYGNLELTLKMISLTRILTKDTHLPATRAIGVAGNADAVALALRAGANVVMLNFTPPSYKKLYEIYPPGENFAVSAGQMIKVIEKMADRLGRNVSYSRADSLKNRNKDVLLKQKLK